MLPSVTSLSMASGDSGNQLAKDGGVAQSGLSVFMVTPGV